MERRQASQCTESVHTALRVNKLRLRVLRAKGGFLSLGTENYIPFIELQARREGLVLTASDKVALRAVMNGRATENDIATVELVERALESQKLQ